MDRHCLDMGMAIFSKLSMTVLNLLSFTVDVDGARVRNGNAD